MRVMSASVVLAAVMLALAASVGGVVARGHGTAQEAVTIGLDVEPAGNTATSLGPIDSCISVSTDDTFEVDIFVTDVADLLAWETYFVYDMSVVNIVSRDVAMFQAANPGSNVFDVSESLPDIDGYYRIAAVDLADPPAPDSGSGVLARLTLKAVGPGVSMLSLSPIDINEDGKLDLGPSLRDTEAESIGDLDGDALFDGPIANAEIAVDGTCPGGTPRPTGTMILASPTPRPTPPVIPEETGTPTGTPAATAAASPTLATSPTATAPAVSPTASAPGEGGDTSSDGGPPWVIVYVCGAVAVVLLGGAATVAIIRRRSR
jgi:hypothetical protein